MALEDEFNVKFRADEIPGMNKFEDFHDSLIPKQD